MSYSLVHLTNVQSTAGQNLAMDRPLKEHIAFLVRRIEELNREIMQNRLSKVEHNRVETEIRAAQTALSYYRRALSIERTLS